jgi:hypothetical protein
MKSLLIAVIIFASLALAGNANSAVPRSGNPSYEETVALIKKYFSNPIFMKGDLECVCATPEEDLYVQYRYKLIKLDFTTAGIMNVEYQITQHLGFFLKDETETVRSSIDLGSFKDIYVLQPRPVVEDTAILGLSFNSNIEERENGPFYQPRFDLPFMQVKNLDLGASVAQVKTVKQHHIYKAFLHLKKLCEPSELKPGQIEIIDIKILPPGSGEAGRKTMREPNSESPVEVPSPSLYRVTGVADNDVLNIREYPNSQSAVIARLQNGSSGIKISGPVTLMGLDEWVLVNVYGRDGWTRSKFLEPARP